MKRFSFAALVLSMIAGPVQGAPIKQSPSVPEPLRPWVPWVLEGDDAQTAHCPRQGEEEHVCAWPARLSFVLGDRGGTFHQAWEIFKPGLITLPGDKEHWPLEVKLNSKPTPIVDSHGEPQVLLPVGRQVLTGRFSWDSLPESIGIPIETGLVALSVLGKPIPFPMRDHQGRLFLGKRAEEATEADTVDISVHRKLTDDMPLLLTTRLTLAVSGKARELLLGKALPAGFEPHAVQSELPLRFERDGHVRVQARPGSFTLEIVGRRVAAENSITRPLPEGLWKDGEEVWAFEARPDLRVAGVEGVPAIDPAQTTLPNEWKSLPTYAMAPGATLRLVEERRGNSQPPPDRFSLQRTYWLDFDGGGYSVRDSIDGEFNRSWRLEMGPGTRLGRVSMNGQNQFITRLGPSGRDGVEIRTGKTRVEADSRIEGRAVPATSFAHDFDSVSATLNIPAGWRLFHVSGADKISGSWIERWSLLEFFLLLLTALAVGRLYGWRSGLLALAALGFSLVEPDAPKMIWLFIILAEVLVRVETQGAAWKVLRVIRAGVWLVLIISLVPFAMREVRQGIHPATGKPGWSPDDEPAGSQWMLLKGSPSEAQVQQLMAAKGDSSEAALDVLSGKGGMGLSGIGEGDLKSEFVALGKPAPRKAKLLPKMKYSPRPTQNLSEYDPTMVVQTGQGMPRWSWAQAFIAWNGPVSQGQTLRIYCTPPWLNGVLAFLRVGLLAFLAWFLLRRPLRLRTAWKDRRPLLAGILTVLLISPFLPNLAQAADLPSKELLEELKERLQPKPDCEPNCAVINDLLLDVSPKKVRVLLQVSAAATASIALPGDESAWLPTEVLLNGKPASALAQSENGSLWLALPQGVFTVELTGPIPQRDSIQIPLPMQPKHASVQAVGFTVDGIHEDGAVDESILLTRVEKAKGEEESASSNPTLPPFLRVERSLRLGLKWVADTKVIRQSPLGTPIMMEIPLLPGESVTTPGIRVEKARSSVALSFAPSDSEISWQSTLAESKEVRLRADPSGASSWAETWHAEVGPTWHATFAGIPPVHRTEAGSNRAPSWRPWPGEEVRIVLTKPQGVTGQTLTIDASSLEIIPGLRGMNANLSLEIRSSRGTQHNIQVPVVAEVTKVTLDGKELPIRQEGQKVLLTVPPDKHGFQIHWRQPLGLTLLFRAPVVDLGIPSTNATVTFRLTEAPRWILWLSGPRLGPAVHFWSVVIVLFLFGWGLARTRLTPLGTPGWVLLGLGLMQMDLMVAAVLPVTFLALGYRAQKPPGKRPALYDLGQVLLVGLVLISVGILIMAVESGLLQFPNMRVMGNGSGPDCLIWYQDRMNSTLPRPMLVSLSTWYYRGAMLVWSLWLAASSIHWARWVWTALKQHGLWAPLRRGIKQPE